MAKKQYLDLTGLTTLVDEIKALLSGKANSSHNHAASNITSGTLSSDRLPTVPIAKGGTGATTAAAALTNLGVTATAAELNIMDGVTATTAEINYVDGVTSNIQSQLNSKAAASHTHDYLPLSGGTITGSIDTDDAYMHNLGSDANPFGVIYSGMFKGNLTGLADSATTAIKLATDAGSATQPVYFSDGKPVACTYTLGKSVPSDAVFTDNNTTYTFATGDSNGQIKVTPSGGSAQNISVKGLGSAAYTASTAYATAAQGTKADNAMPKSGGTFTGDVTCNSGFTTKAAVEIYGATPYIDFHFGNNTGDYTSRIIESASGTISINGVKFASDHVYVPNNSSYRTYTSSGTAIGILYVSDDNNLSLGHYASSSSHTGNTYVNSYSGTVHLRNKTTSLDFTNTSGNNYAGAFMPGSDGKALLGGSSHRWYKLYAASACSTSDEREKSDIMSMSDYPTMYSRSGEGNVFEQLFDKLMPKTYTLNIENTNELHIGFVAQDISKSMEELGLAEEDLGFIDHEYWTDEETGEEKDRYGLIYSEFTALNTYMIQKQKAKIATLEERIAQLEELVSVN